jgi:hypothetical protein
MSKTRIDDILKNKKPGDVWFSLAAPAEVRFWNKDRPWPNDFFDKHGVKLEGLTVKASGNSGEDHKETFDKKHRMYLECGVDVTKGFTNHIQTATASFTLRVDSAREANIALNELSEKTGFDQWETRVMHIYKPPVGIFTEFKVHNPNCQGEGLNTWRFERDGQSKLFAEVSLEFQKKAIGEFYQEFTHCTMEEKTVLEKNCAKKLKRKSKDYKLKKGKPKDQNPNKDTE